MTLLNHPFLMLYRGLTVQLTPHEDICFHSKNLFYFDYKIVFTSVLLGFYNLHKSQQASCIRLPKAGVFFSLCVGYHPLGSPPLPAQSQRKLNLFPIESKWHKSTLQIYSMLSHDRYQVMGSVRSGSTRARPSAPGTPGIESVHQFEHIWS